MTIPMRSKTYAAAAADEAGSGRRTVAAHLKSLFIPQAKHKQARFSHVLARKSRVHRVERVEKSRDDEEFATREIEYFRGVVLQADV